jgi:PKD repeat protein
VANFSAGPTTGAKPLVVTFVDNSTGLITNRFWDFGDSTTTNTSSSNVTHTYNNLGTNTVTLQVTGPLGSSIQVRTNYIAVLDQLIITSIRLSGPDALISFSSQSGKFYRLEYSQKPTGSAWFTAVDFIPGTGSIVQAIDVGGATKGLRFYRVKLLTTADLTPSADFNADKTSGNAPLKVTFTDNSSGVITNRLWSFGDGSSTNTTANSVSHVYVTPGTNTVSLQVSGALGISIQTRTNYVVVGNASPLVISKIQLSGADVVVTFSSQVGVFYRLEYADGPAGPTWQTAADFVPGNGGAVQTTHASGAGKASRFYRVKQLP